MYLIPSLDGLDVLASRQAGVVTRRQLRSLGATHARIDSQLDAGRWTCIAPGVVVLHNHTPTRPQLMWVALLDAGRVSALCSHTSLEQHGFRPFAVEARDIHVIVPRGAKTTSLPGVRIHESRRFRAADKRLASGLPCLDAARSAVDAAAWQPWPRFAMTMMAAAVQQRICTAGELDQALARVGRVRHKQHMRLALQDIAGGAEALSEIDMARVCRRFGLRQPDRQVIRRDPSGRRRYLDCEWQLDDGTVVVLEIDGSHHVLVEHWQADVKRERKIVVTRRFVLRATAAEVYLEPADVVNDLRSLGVPTVTELSEADRAMTR